MSSPNSGTSYAAILCLGVLLACAGLTGLAAADQPAARAFVHPGVNYIEADLVFMRTKLQAKAEPWFGAWEKNKPDAEEDAWKPHAVAEWNANKDFYLSKDPIVAHKHALQWALTGNPANAAKAIEILNAWSGTLKTIAIHEMPQEKLASGIVVHDFVNAAELLVHARPDGKNSGWADADQQRFRTMLGIFYKVIEPFQSGYNGNWDAIMMNSMIAMGIFLDDRAIFDRAVTHYREGKKPNGGLLNYVYPSGQCQESARDQGHVQWGLGALVAVCEIARKQGVDLYGLEDNRLMIGLEYTAKYMLGEEVPFEGKGKISAKGRGKFASSWETAYQHYVFRKGLAMPYTKRIIFGKDAASRRIEGDFTPGISWATFTMFKGEETKAAEAPAAPAKP